MGPPENKSNEEPLKLATYRIKNHKFCNTVNIYYEMSKRTQTNHRYNPEVQSKKNKRIAVTNKRYVRKLHQSCLKVHSELN